MKNGFLNALRSYYPVYRIFKNPFIGQTLQLADVQQLLFFTNRQSLSHYSFLMVRNLILENLLPNCKVLNINTPKKQKVPKETNWKQKFQKPQNENICLTYLNTEM
ncbi:MAG: hypothetical protein MSS57_00060, partial [Bacteroidales bacterium]|nr:hypothetical protein [Bacteroidales bacterium]